MWPLDLPDRVVRIEEELRRVMSVLAEHDTRLRNCETADTFDAGRRAQTGDNEARAARRERRLLALGGLAFTLLQVLLATVLR